MIKTTRLAGLTLLAISSACLAAEAPLGSGAFVLDAGQMDSVTAGAVTVGPTLGVTSATIATAVGAYTGTATSSQTMAWTIPPVNPVDDPVYVSVSGGGALAVAPLALAPSTSTAAVSSHQHPVSAIRGTSIESTWVGRDLQVSVEASGYFSSSAL
jgi:hypothetical protein